MCAFLLSIIQSYAIVQHRFEKEVEMLIFNYLISMTCTKLLLCAFAYCSTG